MSDLETDKEVKIRWGTRVRVRANGVLHTSYTYGDGVYNSYYEDEEKWIVAESRKNHKKGQEACWQGVP